jgi:hypothetical protein
MSNAGPKTNENDYSFSCQMRFFPQWLRMEESTLQAIHRKKEKNVASQIEKFLPEW